MSLHTPIRDALSARPTRIITDTFETVMIGDNGRTHALGDFPTLDDAIGRCEGLHKAQFYVRVTSGLSGSVVHKFYQVKKRAKGERRYADHQSRIVHDTYAEHLFDVNGEVL